MNSKEAFNKIYNHLIAILEMDAPELIRIYERHKNIVIDDLEVLEIIKNKLVFLLGIMYLSYETYNALMDEKQNLTQEEYNKIKEWLENENTPRT